MGKTKNLHRKAKGLALKEKRLKNEGFNTEAAKTIARLRGELDGLTDQVEQTKTNLDAALACLKQIADMTEKSRAKDAQAVHEAYLDFLAEHAQA